MSADIQYNITEMFNYMAGLISTKDIMGVLKIINYTDLDMNACYSSCISVFVLLRLCLVCIIIE